VTMPCGAACSILHRRLQYWLSNLFASSDFGAWLPQPPPKLARRLFCRHLSTALRAGAGVCAGGKSVGGGTARTRRDVRVTVAIRGKQTFNRSRESPCWIKTSVLSLSSRHRPSSAPPQQRPRMPPAPLSWSCRGDTAALAALMVGKQSRDETSRALFAQGILRYDPVRSK
jgi:hypothetical protein